jgi:hypothetical protein
MSPTEPLKIWGEDRKPLKNKPRKIDAVIREFVREMGMEEIYQIGIIEGVLEDIFDKRMMEIIEIESFAYGVLTINVALGSWRSEMFFRREKLKDEINGKLGKILIKEVKIR